MHRTIYFGWDSAPDPTGELTALSHTPYLDLRGHSSKGRGEERRDGRSPLDQYAHGIVLYCTVLYCVYLSIYSSLFTINGSKNLKRKKQNERKQTT